MPGMFAASTALLPSSFAMYAMTMAAASVISGRPQEVVPLAAVGIVWGWIVAAVAFVPYALYVLVTAPLSESLQMAISWLLITAAPVVVVDRYFYGAWKARAPCLCLTNLLTGHNLLAARREIVDAHICVCNTASI